MVWILFIVVAASILGWVANQIGKGADDVMSSATEDQRGPKPVDPGAVDRVERVAALKEKGGAAAIAELETLAQDPDRTVRSLARSALDDLRSAR